MSNVCLVTVGEEWLGDCLSRWLGGYLSWCTQSVTLSSDRGQCCKRVVERVSQSVHSTSLSSDDGRCYKRVVERVSKLVYSTSNVVCLVTVDKAVRVRECLGECLSRCTQQVTLFV